MNTLAMEINNDLIEYNRMRKDDDEFKDTYQGFNSEREQTTHYLDSMSQKPLKNISDDPLEIAVQFHINHTVHALLWGFKGLLKNKGYQCVEIFEGELLVVRLKFIDRLKSLLICRQPSKFILKVSTDQFRSKRLASIKPLKNKMLSKQRDYSKTLQEVKNMAIWLTQWGKMHQDALSDKMDQLESDYRQDFYSLQATAHYMFGKMLADANYGLGKKIHSIAKKFEGINSFGDCREKDVVWLNRSLNEVSDDLLQGFNCSRKELLEILSYCRRSVQDFFYAHHLPAYQSKLEVVEESLSQEQKAIKKVVPHTFKQLELLRMETCSMGIFKQIFMVGHFFKVETELLRLEQPDIDSHLQIIRSAFEDIIQDKARLLTGAGYKPCDYEEYGGNLFKVPSYSNLIKQDGD